MSEEITPLPPWETEVQGNNEFEDTLRRLRQCMHTELATLDEEQLSESVSSEARLKLLITFNEYENEHEQFCTKLFMFGSVCSCYRTTMKWLTIFFVLTAGMLFEVSTAHADGCNARARQMAGAKANVTLLAVKSKVNNNGKTVCTVTLRIVPKDGKPPRIVTRRFAP